jgi:hypothetical protein
MIFPLLPTRGLTGNGGKFVGNRVGKFPIVEEIRRKFPINLFSPCKINNILRPIKIINIIFNRKFRWKFNNSGEILFLDSERYSKNGTRSILHYTPVTEQVCVVIFISSYYISILFSVTLLHDQSQALKFTKII